MRISINTLFAVCIACASLGFSNAVAEPALVVKTSDKQAVFLDGDGNAVPVFCDELLVVTNSSTEVITVRCKTRVPNNSGQAVSYDIYNNPFYFNLGLAIPCGILTPDGLVLTEDWKETVSASGVAIFRCKAKTSLN